MGVSQPAYTEEELKNIDPPPFTYQGRTYTAYQAQQQMRKMERAMRKQKDRCITADAAGDKDAFTAASIKLRRQKDIYEDFCKAAGTYTEYERTFVQGYDRHLAAKTGAVTRAQNKFKNAQVTLTNSGNGGIIKTDEERGIEQMLSTVAEKPFAAGNRRSPLYELNEKEIEMVKSEIKAIGANVDDFVFNSTVTRGTCFLPSDGKIHIKGNIFPDEFSDHPRDKLTVRAVLAHEYYGHKPYRSQYLHEDSITKPEEIERIFANAWADEFRASYMAAKNTPNLSDEERAMLILDSLSRAKEAGVTIKNNDFIRRVLYG